MSGFKVQVYGDPKKKAKAYNFSISLMGGYGRVVNNVEEGEGFELIPQDDDTNSELDISNSTAGILFGYRVSDKTLVNLSQYTVIHEFNGELES